VTLQMVALSAFFTTVAVHPKLLVNIAFIYRRPNSDLTRFQEAVQTLLNDMSMIECDDPTVEIHAVIGGDFNFDWNDHSVQTMMSALLPSYSQLVKDVTTDYSSTLDHVYTTLPVDVVECFTTECYFTDHKLLTVCISNVS